MVWLKKKAIGDNPADLFASSVSEGFDYLAIGNSITVHGVSDFWWAEYGMAASRPENDYVHQVADGISEEDINTGVYNYSIWETQAHDRTETYELLDKWLEPEIDLITVQLSENCSDTTTFTSDFKALITHVFRMCPDACVVVIDDFWNEERHEMKKAVCSELGVAFVDLSDIAGMAEWQAGIGTEAWGVDGATHIIEHQGVAIHPGDNAMELIADRTLELFRSFQKRK